MIEQQMLPANSSELPSGRYVLVEEYGDYEGASCRGDVLRAWTVDERGLLEISLEEHALHLQEIQRRIYPFIQIMFCFHHDRRRVVLGHAEANTAGSGCVYHVVGPGGNAKLIPDESLGFWRS